VLSNKKKEGKVFTIKRVSVLENGKKITTYEGEYTTEQEAHDDLGMAAYFPCTDEGEASRWYTVVRVRENSGA
jgi:hypothetical protein